jgi:hypothetical protein
MAESLEVTAPETEVNPLNTRVLEDVAPASVARIWKLDTEVDKTLDLQRSGVESTRKQFAESEARMAPLRKGAEESLSRPIPELGDLTKPPQAPSGPIIDPEQFKGFASVAFPFVMLLGTAMRANGVQALNALSSSVQGYMQGRKEESAHQLQQFKTKMGQVTEDNKQKIEKYRAILERRDLENNQKLSLLKLEAMTREDIAMAHAAETKTFDSIFKRIEQEKANTLKVAKLQEQVVKDYEDNITKREHYQAMQKAAELRYSEYRSHRADALSQKKENLARQAAYKAYADYSAQVARIAGNAMLGGKSKTLAVDAARKAFAFKMKHINETARLEGIEVPPEAVNAENEQYDVLGPVSNIDASKEQESWLNWWKSFWPNQTGTQPGVNPGVTQPPAQPGQVIDFNQLPPQ